ncbi:hypothetical protein SLA_5814 [Streptomyces laurentii]|uniref:Uncharacterized protein n=1 Tax=Streptomyces laurentii TaxID=39478 RepID=A0A160P798_STRLU|nr:hypothetical protein SLA_5814 [Streptomyces laurentii]
MDAERLIANGRYALAEAHTAWDIMREAWEAQALAQVIGGHLAAEGPLELRSEARGLSETGGGRVGFDHPALRAGVPRAAQLTSVGDTRAALTALGVLLGDVGIALVGVACATGEDGLYWQSIEAIDAADEAGDRVRAMLHRLAVRERDRPPDPARGRAGPG